MKITFGGFSLMPPENQARMSSVRCRGRTKHRPHVRLTLARLPGQVGVTPGIVTALPLDGDTRDGVETVGPVCAAG